MNVINKTTLIGLTILSYLTGFSQSKYFTHDTLDKGVEVETGKKDFRIGEIWYLTTDNSNKDTFHFTKNFSLDSYWKFEIYNTGYSHIEGGLISCGKWTLGFLASYKIKDNEIEFFNMDNVKEFPPFFNGQFIIKEYSEKSMLLIRKN